MGGGFSGVCEGPGVKLFEILRKLVLRQSAIFFIEFNGGIYHVHWQLLGFVGGS